MLWNLCQFWLEVEVALKFWYDLNNFDVENDIKNLENGSYLRESSPDPLSMDTTIEWLVKIAQK